MSYQKACLLFGMFVLPFFSLLFKLSHISPCFYSCLLSSRNRAQPLLNLPTRTTTGFPSKKKSLFGNLVSPTSISSKALDKRMEKEVFLHAVTLTDYLRVKRIPQCLRINKDHSIGKNNDTFCDCWSEILNKCSFDLTALNSQHIFC